MQCSNHTRRFPKSIFILIIIIICFAQAAWTAGAKESASSQRGIYLAEQGYIIPAEEVYIDSYISALDYTYPKPQDALGVYAYSGNHRASSEGGETIIHIGLQGRETDFADLPPLNLAFVIDISGSMAADNKLELVKKAFVYFINRIRDNDFVSLVVFDHEVKTLIPSIAMASQGAREQFRMTVASLQPRGSTNLTIGLQQGYKEVMSNFRTDYTNRVLFLTDGVGNSENMLEMAESYSALGVNVSTIGVGTGFDTDLMMALAEAGGGSSRFIANEAEMEKIFSSELDRMVVPAALDIRIDLELGQGVQLLETWGYNYQHSAGTIHYSLATLHNRDYETIIARVAHGPGQVDEERLLGRINISYQPLGGGAPVSDVLELSLLSVSPDQLTNGYSDSMVLKSGMILRYAQELREIGSLWYQSEDDQTAAQAAAEPDYTIITEMADRTRELRNSMYNVQERLNEVVFDREILILNNYLETFARLLEWDDGQSSIYSQDRSITPREIQRNTLGHIQAVYQELAARLQRLDRQAGTVSLALADFYFQTSVQYEREFYAVLSGLLQESGRTTLGAVPGLRLLASSEVYNYLHNGSLSAQDMMDTTRARALGRELGADVLVTGTVLELGTSFVLFARLIDVSSGEILSSSQVVVEKQKLLLDILGY